MSLSVEDLLKTSRKHALGLLLRVVGVLLVLGLLVGTGAVSMYTEYVLTKTGHLLFLLLAATLMLIGWHLGPSHSRQPPSTPS